MRIIAGNLGGRHFASPHGHRTHPMSDKMRGALFNTLGDIGGLSVLDAFAGSGALSFESISRGALSSVAIDSDRNAQLTISENTDSLGIKKQVKLIRASASAWLGTTSDKFDLVLLDPPYDQTQTDLIARLAERTKPGGTLVMSLPPSIQVILPENFDKLAQKDYGDGTLGFYRAN
jgi:16S rRNA (guanine966-N2)-methyltransferase